MLEAETQDILGRECAVEIGLDIGALADLVLTVVHHAAPGRKAGKQAFARNPSAENRRRLGKRDVIAAQRKRARRFEPGGAGAYDEYLLALALLVHPLRMPALAPL